MSSFVCLNPHCSGRRRRFVSEKSFAMHLQKSTSCWHFFRARMSAGLASSLDSNCLVMHCLISSAAKDANALYGSSQRSVSQRCTKPPITKFLIVTRLKLSQNRRRSPTSLKESLTSNWNPQCQLCSAIPECSMTSRCASSICPRQWRIEQLSEEQE